MNESTAPKMQFDVASLRPSSQGNRARSKQGSITLDTDLVGNPQAFNPAESLLATLSACMIEGIERVTPILEFDLRGVEVRVHGVREDVPLRLESIRFEIEVDTDEPDRRPDPLHENVKKHGTVFNTVASRAALSGVLRRKGGAH